MASEGSAVRVVAFNDQQQITTPVCNVISESFEELSSCISFTEQQDKAIILIATTIYENILQSFELLTPIEAILIFATTSKDVDTLPKRMIGIYPQTEILLRSLSQILEQARLLFQSNTQIQSSSDDFETLYKPNQVIIRLNKHRHPFPS